MDARPFLLLALLGVSAGCGEASWNADLAAVVPLERGARFDEAIERHGCPDSVQEIDSETFTISWERSRIVAVAPFYAHHEQSSLTYLVRRGKVVNAALTSPASSTGLGIGFGADAFVGATRPQLGASSTALALIPLVLVVLAWELGRKLGERARHARRPLAIVSLLLLGTSWGVERSGAVPSSGVAEGSPAAELLQAELGRPRILHLPGDQGALFVYSTHESKHVVVGGSETIATQAYLVQKNHVVKESPRTSTLVAQYYLFPFFETAQARLHAAIAWSVTLATIALALATRRRPAVISPPP